MMALPNLRVACVGAGYFAQFHYDSWARMDRVDLVGSCDHDVGKAQATGLPAFSNLSAMLKSARRTADRGRGRGGRRHYCCA